ncbi:hypothetical protein [Variovorax paradoxus]|uniref:Uncharacterized protein n=1 Tax=Variovorax paradoxus TaxID=34073 RepID=A0A0H2LZY4_VARPD|nr:hypothetical protein [Variovorax paradoxus]KLN55738.1 hypothetical protein VPARA_31040 [Variovorax paradoxus]
MNPQWNTPPNGDFASYVERLSAQAALPKRAAHEGDHGLDVGITPAPGAQGAAAAAAQRRESSNGDTSAPGAGAFTPTALKIMAAVGAVVLLALWSAGVSLVVLVFLAGAAFWLASKFKGLKLSPGVAKWQQVLEEAARKQREQQHKQGK